MEIGLNSLYKGISNVYSIEKVSSLGMGEGNPLKRPKTWERGALMVRIIAKGKYSKKVYLIVYFHLRFSTA